MWLRRDKTPPTHQAWNIELQQELCIGPLHHWALSSSPFPKDVDERAQALLWALLPIWMSPSPPNVGPWSPEHVPWLHMMDFSPSSCMVPVLVDMRENSLEVELYPEPAFEGKAQVWKEKKVKKQGNEVETLCEWTHCEQLKQQHHKKLNS